ncbi:MAG: ABC transporter substrate-binding protein [Lachnospiraceae bacterium]|nr:ABC transporter substrate-binding protein [Lachnospiraceae bacterium]
MMKKAMSLILALSMAVASLTGCGSAASGTAETESAAAGTTFKIGGIGPVTGGAAVYGLAVKNGAQIAIDEINAAGGVNGAQLEFNFQDDEHDAEKSVNAYNTLKDWNMQALMGTVTSTPCIAVAEETNKDQVFQLTPSGSSVPCVQYDNAFRICFSDPNQGLKSAQYIGENGLATKVAIIFDSSDVYSSGIKDKFVEEAPNQGIEVVAQEAFTADSKTDFTVQLQKAKDAGAELVFLPIYYSEAALILAQANTTGFTPQFFGCDGLDGILTVENFDTALAENVMLLTPFAADAQDDLTKKFVETYNKNFGETPNQFAADAYDAIYAIKAALEEAKATPDMSAQDLCPVLETAMTKINMDGLTGEGMTWTADGEVNKAPKAVKIVKGAYTAMD